MKGWISLHRKIAENPLWFSEPFTRGQAWVDLLLLANHEYTYFYKRGNKIDVHRGQVGRSAVELADRWKWSRSKVRKFLNDLEKEQQIEQQKNTVTQVLTIKNFEKYQKKEQQTIQQKDSRRAAEEQQKNTYNNDNNVNNDNKDLILSDDNNKKDTSLWEADADPQYLDFCERYYLMLQDHGKITKSVNWKTKKWYDTVRLMVEKDEITMSELNHTLTFLNNHLLDEFCPQVWSLPTLREKWIKVKAYMEKSGGKYMKLPKFDMSTLEGRKAATAATIEYCKLKRMI